MRRACSLEELWQICSCALPDCCPFPDLQSFCPAHDMSRLTEHCVLASFRTPQPPPHAHWEGPASRDGSSRCTAASCRAICASKPAPPCNGLSSRPTGRSSRLTVGLSHTLELILLLDGIPACQTARNNLSSYNAARSVSHALLSVSIPYARLLAALLTCTVNIALNSKHYKSAQCLHVHTKG